MSLVHMMPKNLPIHSHFDEVTGRDPSIITGLYAAGDRIVAVLKELVARSKLDPTSPLTISTCCEQEYVLRYVYHETRHGEVWSAYFTVDGDTANSVYALLAGAGMVASVVFSARLRTSFPRADHRNVEDLELSDSARSISAELNSINTHEFFQIMGKLEEGLNVTVLDKVARQPRTLAPLQKVSPGRPVLFRIDRGQELFCLSRGSSTIRKPELRISF